MDNPLTSQIEEITSKVIGDMKYKGKQVVLLEDAISALEELESKLWSLCQVQIQKIQKQEFHTYH